MNTQNIHMRVEMYVLPVLSLLSASIVANPLNGRRIKAVGAELATVYYVKRDDKGKATGYGGPSYLLLHWLSQRLNFTFEIETLPYFDWGSKSQNGSYNGLFGHIQRQESDVALGAFGAITLEPFMEMSFPWAVYDFAMLIPYPTEQSKIWAAFLPFQLKVWLGFLLSSAALAGAMTFYRLKTTGNHRSPIKIGSDAMYLVGVATAQGGYLARRGRSVMILATAWCLTMFVMVTAYSGLLISFLSAIRLVPVVDSVHELAQNSPGLDIYTFLGSNADRSFMDAGDGDLKIVGDYLRRHPNNRKKDNEQCKELAFKNQGICFTGKKGVELYASKIWKETGQCLFTRSKHTYFPVQVYLLFNKNNPYHREINHQILVATGVGLTKKWFEDEGRVWERCLERTNGAKNRPLRLKDLSSTFLILGIGVVASLTAYAFELKCARSKWRRVADIPNQA